PPPPPFFFNLRATTPSNNLKIGGCVSCVYAHPPRRWGVTRTMFIGCAVAESTGIYGLLVALLLMFANPFINKINN
ncbi:MAG: hypothetical protein K2O52_03210, partial [Oscillospiraceae bacterium]|nr:hypothetical protein [Oscillospiraceae bacterium]